MVMKELQASRSFLYFLIIFAFVGPACGIEEETTLFVDIPIEETEATTYSGLETYNPRSNSTIEDNKDKIDKVEVLEVKIFVDEVHSENAATTLSDGALTIVGSGGETLELSYSDLDLTDQTEIELEDSEVKTLNSLLTKQDTLTITVKGAVDAAPVKLDVRVSIKVKIELSIL